LAALPSLLQLDPDLDLDDPDADSQHHEHLNNDIFHCESVVRVARRFFGLSDNGPKPQCGTCLLYGLAGSGRIRSFQSSGRTGSSLTPIRLGCNLRSLTHRSTSNDVRPYTVLDSISSCRCAHDLA